MNDNGDLYSKNSGAQTRDAANILNKYLKLFELKSDGNILDVGCGEGTVSLEVLLPKLPKTFKKLVLCDIQGKLLQHAMNRCKDPRVEFLQMDIAINEIPENLYHHFDHIFSFYCLQWVTGKNRLQRAFENIYHMLKPGGSILFSIITDIPSYDIFERMAKTRKWATYTKHFKKFVPVYYHDINPAEKLKEALKTK